MTATTYANIVKNAVDTVQAILQGNATILTLIEADNIWTYVPAQLTKGTGYPHIVVSGPPPDDADWTFSLTQGTVSITIEALSRKTDVNQQLVDAVRRALRLAEATSEGVNLRHLRLTGGGMTPSVLDDESIVYVSTINAIYDWYGDADG